MARWDGDSLETQKIKTELYVWFKKKEDLLEHMEDEVDNKNFLFGALDENGGLRSSRTGLHNISSKYKSKAYQRKLKRLYNKLSEIYNEELSFFQRELLKIRLPNRLLLLDVYQYGLYHQNRKTISIDTHYNVPYEVFTLGGFGGSLTKYGSLKVATVHTVIPEKIRKTPLYKLFTFLRIVGFGNKNIYSRNYLKARHEHKERELDVSDLFDDYKSVHTKFDDSFDEHPFTFDSRNSFEDAQEQKRLRVDVQSAKLDYQRLVRYAISDIFVFFKIHYDIETLTGQIDSSLNNFEEWKSRILRIRKKIHKEHEESSFL